MPMDREMLAYQLSTASRIPDQEYVKYGVGPEQIAALKSDLTGWAGEIRARAANPDIDQSMRVAQSGVAAPGQGESRVGAGEASRHGSPYDRGRGPESPQR